MLPGYEQPADPHQDQHDKRDGIAPVVKDRLAPFSNSCHWMCSSAQRRLRLIELIAEVCVPNRWQVWGGAFQSDRSVTLGERA